MVQAEPVQGQVTDVVGSTAPGCSQVREAPSFGLGPNLHASLQDNTTALTGESLGIGGSVPFTSPLPLDFAGSKETCNKIWSNEYVELLVCLNHLSFLKAMSWSKKLQMGKVLFASCQHIKNSPKPSMKGHPYSQFFGSFYQKISKRKWQAPKIWRAGSTNCSYRW